MLQFKKLKFMLALMTIVMLCLNSCATTSCKTTYSCPVYPIAGEKVAQELKKADYASFPYTWEWIGRINKLRQELELCQGSKFLK